MIYGNAWQMALAAAAAAIMVAMALAALGYALGILMGAW